MAATIDGHRASRERPLPGEQSLGCASAQEHLSAMILWCRRKVRSAVRSRSC